MESQKSLVELIKAKEEEFEKLTKVKEMLQGQNTKLKAELDDTKKEIEKLKKSLKEKKGGSTPTSEDSDLAQQYAALQEEHLKLQQTFKELQAEKATSENGGALSVEKLMEQVKTGMFKLGQQNFSIEQKIDQLLERSEETRPSIGVKRDQKSVSTSSQSVVSEPSLMKPSQLLSSKHETPGPPSNPPPKPIPSVKLEPEPSEESPKAGLKPPVVQLDMMPESDYQEEVSSKSEILPPLPGPPTSKDKSPFSPSSLNLITLNYPLDGVIVCPRCGEQSFSETPNKNKVLSYTPLKYAKKYYCKACRQEWDYKL